MKQMQVPDSVVVTVDYEDSNIPASVREFRPALWRESDLFYCLLGADPQAGIFGCGPTPQDAFRDWATAFNERLSAQREGDELVQYIEDTRNTSKKDVW